MTHDDIIRMARECGDWNGQTCEMNDVGLERFAALVAAAAADRACADYEAERSRHSVPMCQVGQAKRALIDALVGDRLTADKADHICERDGYAVTGVVLTLQDGRSCIVNRSAVRWLQAGDLFNLLHTDSAINQRLVNEAVATEREACAKVCEEMDVERTNYCMHIYEEGEQYKSAVIAAIRARGSAAPTVHNPAGIHEEDVS